MTDEILHKLINDGVIIITTKDAIRNAVEESITHLRIDRSDFHHDVKDFDFLKQEDFDSISNEIAAYLKYK